MFMYVSVCVYTTSPHIIYTAWYHITTWSAHSDTAYSDQYEVCECVLCVDLLVSDRLQA